MPKRKKMSKLTNEISEKPIKLVDKTLPKIDISKSGKELKKIPQELVERVLTGKKPKDKI